MAALDFPHLGLVVGQKYPEPPVPGQPVYTWDGEKWTTLGGAVGSTGASDAVPQPDTATGTSGSSTQWSRGDHAHPQDPLKAPLASPAFTGNPTAPTPAQNDNDTTIATTAFVANAAQSKVAKAGDTMTGPLILNADPSSGLGAATKQYVDARYQRIALAGLVQSDVTVPTGAVAARLIGTLYPLNTDAYPLLQLSVAPGVFRNTAGEYVLNGFQHSVTGTPTAVTPLTNINTQLGMLLCVANSATAAISFIFTATVVLKRPNTSAVFTCDAQGVAFVGGVNNHSFFHNYMGAGAVSGSALSILALRIVNGVGEVWGNESYVNVEWL